MKMSLDEDSILTVEEVEKALTEIENKYSPVKCSKRKDCLEGTLTVLSKEFDSLGLSAIDLTQPITKIFKQIVSSARSLVQIHRRTISQIKDVNIDNRYKDTKSLELYVSIIIIVIIIIIKDSHSSKDDVALKLLRKYKTNEEIYKSTIQTLQENNKDLMNEILDLKEECSTALCNSKKDCT
ncbi:hypothetical protein NQ314_021312 [Rhamnusium bicolor]|uniref:Uncharacterized protein n=1 Tax=Rhamnusium bicolor TaxID=1586634 RepID=A0AAV8WIF0_9CUCU|nr:hypothetical protein NQ314_021312 [Rhamnusium bicolor]